MRTGRPKRRNTPSSRQEQNSYWTEQEDTEVQAGTKLEELKELKELKELSDLEILLNTFYCD